MKLRAKDLYDLKVIDKIIEESQEITEENFENVSNILKKEIKFTISKLKKKSVEDIIEERYQKFRNIGEYVYIDKV